MMARELAPEKKGDRHAYLWRRPRGYHRRGRSPIGTTYCCRLHGDQPHASSAARKNIRVGCLLTLCRDMCRYIRRVELGTNSGNARFFEPLRDHCCLLSRASAKGIFPEATAAPTSASRTLTGRCHRNTVMLWLNRVSSLTFVGISNIAIRCSSELEQYQKTTPALLCFLNLCEKEGLVVCCSRSPRRVGRAEMKNSDNVPAA